MDFYVIDWSVVASFLSAATTLFTGIVAIFIFKKWKSQKGSEVISIEAKKIFKSIDQISTVLSVVFEDMLKMAIDGKVPIEFPKENFINFRTLNIDIIKSLDLIIFKNEDKQTISIVNKFNDNYRALAMLYHKQGKIQLNDMLECKEKYVSSAKALKDEMYKYALYKKTIKS